MIIREEEDKFILIKQHDHAHLSGDIAKHLNNNLFIASNREDIITAAYQHDRSWIKLDETARWNEQSCLPYSFIDYPLIPKLEAYVLGLDEIEVINKYSGLLCSLHYSSFFKTPPPPECLDFIRNEEKRQQRILDNLKVTNKTTVLNHLEILQFTDRLSLYVCLNKPGANKEDEYTWYKNGIPYSEKLNPLGDKPILTYWVNEHEISVVGFPFDREFRSIVKYKSISKASINEKTIARAYSEAVWQEHEIIFKK